MYLYQNDVYLCKCYKIVPYNSSKAERTEADEESMTNQSKEVAKFDKFIKDGKEWLPKVKIIEKTKDYNMLEPETVDVTPDSSSCNKPTPIDKLLDDYDPEYYAQLAIEQM